MRLLITSAKGFIGSNFLERSKVLNNYNVDVLYRNFLPKKHLKTDINFIEADLRDSETCKSIFKNYDVIFHCAGVMMTTRTLKLNPFQGLIDNLKIHTNLVESIKSNPPKKFIWLSSTTGYPDSNKSLTEDEFFTNEVCKRYEIVGSLYRLMEKIINKELIDKCTLVTLRPTGVFGEYDDFSLESSHILPKIIRDCSLKLLPEKIFAQKEETRNWLYIGDLIEALDRVIEKISISLSLNIGSQKSTSMHKLYSILLSYYSLENNHSLETTNIYSEPPLSRDIDCNLSEHYLGKYNKTTLEEGLLKTINWYKNELK